MKERDVPCPCCNCCMRVVDGRWVQDKEQYDYCVKKFDVRPSD